MTELMARLTERSPETIVDIGCGTGQWMLEALNQGVNRALGVDTDRLALAEAHHRASRDGLRGRTHLLCADASYVEEITVPDPCFVCVGASHALSGYRGLLEVSSRVADEGQMILVGEGYWEEDPAAEYLEFLDWEEESLRTHRENVLTAERHGFDVVYATTATLPEWDDFEWEFYKVAVDYARQYPTEDAIERLRERQAWRDGYLRWGRGVMGFGYYILRRVG